MSSARQQQRQEWSDWLTAMAYFQDIPIVQEEKKDITSEITRRLAGTYPGGTGKSGLMIILLTVKLKLIKTADAGPVVNFIHCAHIVENPTINQSSAGTGLSRQEVLEYLIAATHANFTPTSARAPFMASDFEIMIDDGTKLPSEDAFFETPAMIGITLNQVADPVIALNGNNSAGHVGITITGSTPGAAIFYTLDGSAPGTGKNLFTGDFLVQHGTTIRARAWLAGQIASNPVLANIT